ncbi:NAD(P)-dependent oxidoreductase [Serinicoccus sediminis]|uniref:NAD(P)-dependent oxidoreductase n=1 Tax=Serinicoccus sediminis TaxID=2306021 RepID=UPI0010201088|nr:NAD(P)H-binding protein [Serinicoccus sediminis]
MRIAVLGATGRTGRPFVELALAGGHEVTALVRSPHKRSLLPAGVDVVDGDATDRAALEPLVAGCDAVVDLLAPERGGLPDLRRQVVPGLVAAMRAGGVRRLLLLTGAGVRVPADTPKVADRLIVGVMRRVAAQTLEDAEQAVAALTSHDDLDWTVVRAPRLLDGDPTGRARTFPGVGRGSSTSVRRADLARWLLEEVERPAWVHQHPVVTS